MENILQIADLTKRYPDFYLDHLTLNVPSGSIVGLIGENGAGKTTTMNLILNAVTKDSGDILVFGQDNLSHEKEVKQRIGVVQDECNLPFMFSPADIETIMRQIYAQWDSNRYWELLNRFDLPVKQEIGSFSKGMKVKMNFAIALAHHAELLLLDEATSGLDPVMVAELIDHIEVYHAEKQDGITNQRVDIHYNCIGAFDVPDRRKIPEADIIMETRKGVALSYAPEQVAV